MSTLNEMAKERLRVLTTRVVPEEHHRITMAIKQAGSTQDRFILDAIMEKFKRGGIEITTEGVLRDLPPDDREIVEWIANLLRKCPKDSLVRSVLIAQKGVLLAVAERIE